MKGWVSGRCLKGVRKVSGRYLEGVWKVSGGCLEGVNFLGPNFFRYRILSAPKFFQDTKFFMTTIFRTQTFSGPKFFGTRNFSGPKLFSGPKCFESIFFGSQNIWYPKLFGTQNFYIHISLEPKFFRDPNILRPKTFLNQ